MRLAIDDFGTGYSSLAYLRQFSVDALKIDRSFIRGVAASSESAALIHTLVRLGKTLNLETLAEGIEDHEQLRALQRQDCDMGQGFLLAPAARARGGRRVPGRARHRRARVRLTQLQSELDSDASGRVGSNSSTGLPDGSSTRICLPPTPVTISLRKRAPALAQLRDQRLEVGDLELEAVPAAGRGQRAVRHRLPRRRARRPARSAASRRSPLESIANGGAGCITSWKPSCPQ